MNRSAILLLLPILLLGCPKKPEPIVVVEEPDPYPQMVCPENTEKKGKPPPDGMKVWCMEFLPQGKWVNEGPYVEFYETGEKKVEGSYTNDRREGTFTDFYISGQVEIEAVYIDNYADGPWVEYHENGQKRAEGEKVHGKEIGPWLYWHDNGNKRMEGVFADGSHDGKWIEYEADGTPRVERIYKFGRLLTQKVLTAN